MLLFREVVLAPARRIDSRPQIPACASARHWICLHPTFATCAGASSNPVLKRFPDCEPSPSDDKPFASYLSVTTSGWKRSTAVQSAHGSGGRRNLICVSRDSQFPTPSQLKRKTETSSTSRSSEQRNNATAIPSSLPVWNAAVANPFARRMMTLGEFAQFHLATRPAFNVLHHARRLFQE